MTERHAATGQIVVAGAGYAGLHVALRLSTKTRNNPNVELTLVDRHGDHEVVTEQDVRCLPGRPGPILRRRLRAPKLYDCHLGWLLATASSAGHRWRLFELTRIARQHAADPRGALTAPALRSVSG